MNYANDYASHFHRLPNIFLCSYPEYLSQDSFFSIRPFFKLVKGSGVEVGTFEGYNATNVLKYCSLDKLYCVDPYRPYVDVVGKLGSFSPEAWDAVYQKAKERIGNKAELIRKPSLEAVNDFKDESLDFVYLDGDHSRENVLKEIVSWLPKVKVGGLFGGHDCRESGVLGAVTEWNMNHSEYDGKISTQSNDWWLIKE
ncbi:MAG: class I SAM-dependent methyltransferase [Candidatus Paceibacterota bacterium]